MAHPRLSICIPTHHGRSEMLAVALESISRSAEEAGVTHADGSAARPALAPEEWEVCISDNASQDGTEAVVTAFTARGLPIVYRRSEQDIGASPNLLRVVAEASGKFCWLMGSDDALAPAALATVSAALRAHPDLTGLTVAKRNFDQHLGERIGDDPPHLVPRQPDRNHLFTTQAEVAEEILPALGFMSAQVVRREAWLSALQRLGPNAAAEFPILFYLYVLGEMALHEPRWLWVSEPLVRRRTGTSDFRELAPWIGEERYRSHLSIVRESDRIWAATVGRGPQHRRLMEGVCIAFVNWGTLLWHKLGEGHTSADDLRMLRGFTAAAWRVPRFWSTAAPVLLLPHHAVKALARLRRLLRPAMPRELDRSRR